MAMIDALIDEFKRETETTRRHLDRLPADNLDWRPHEKSFTTRGLASHIVECIGWTDSIFRKEEVDFDPATYKPFEAGSKADLLKVFDENVAAGERALAGAADADLAVPWRLKVMGRVRFERPRLEVFRDFTLSHVVHHRGQMSVYLRLMNVPVPGSYGPTADEQG
jgi:uncharacterized damage-inducible protein DinB